MVKEVYFSFRCLTRDRLKFDRQNSSVTTRQGIFFNTDIQLNITLKLL